MKEAFKKSWWIGAFTLAEIIGNIFYFVVSFAALTVLLTVPDLITEQAEIVATFKIVTIILVAPICLGISIQWSGIVGKINSHIIEYEKNNETVSNN